MVSKTDAGADVCQATGAVGLVNGCADNHSSMPAAKEGVPLQKNGTATNQDTTTSHVNGDTLKGENGLINGIAAIGDSQEHARPIDEAADEQEVVVIQETGFTVKIHAPGVEPFDLQVSSQEMVQEIHQVLMDREDTCHRTCFSLQLDGNVLDNFAELKSITGLCEGAVIKVVEEPYTVREARIHVRHVRDLLKSLDPSDAYNGVDCSSLVFLHVITEGDITDSSLLDTRRRKRRSDSIDCTPPEYILPGSKELPLLPLQPQAQDNRLPQSLKVMTLSGWNPPPGSRKMKGDLLYLYVVTMEDRHVSITAATRGFYVNQSTTETFNPKPAIPSFLSHSLVELLGQISPIFKKNFSALQRKRTLRHPFERVPTPFQVYSWIAPQTEHTIDCVRAEDAYTSRLGYEEHIPGQTRDWNEEIQTTRELPKKNLPERLVRERAIFKVQSDFVAAATRGAMAVVDGNVMAINPGEDSKMQMFIWNNIFFSLGFDVKDHYKEFGGDSAAYAATALDLAGVRAYSALDTEGLYTLGTAVIDYRGYRVTAQSIIPGILEREQEHSVVYGSIDFGKTVVSHPKYLELLEKTAVPLKILRHKVLNENAEAVELCSAVECKGIIGNDGRYYILDLLRTFPPDVNFLPVAMSAPGAKPPGKEVTKAEVHRSLPVEPEMLEFARNHRHSLCCLRQELLEAFVDHRYLRFMEHAALQLVEREAYALEQGGSSVETQRLLVEAGAHELQPDVGLSGQLLAAVAEAQGDEKSKDVIRKACSAIGSVSESSFDIRFNLDVFSPGVRFPEESEPEVQTQRQLIHDVASFLLSRQIPGLVHDCLEHSSLPMDGATLTEALHQRGINLRYLGILARLLERPHFVSRVQQGHFLPRMVVSEIILRSAKHIFKAYLQGVEMSGLSVAVSHYLNCLFSSFPNPVAHLPVDELTARRRRNRRRNRNLASNDNTVWASLTPSDLWKQICSESLEYFGYTLHCDGVEQAVEKHGLQKVSLLREFCLKSGVQLLLREFNMDSRQRPAFIEEDILNIFPIVKHVHPKATDAFHFFQSGQVKVKQGFLKEGYELISEALNLFNNVYGAMHPEICTCLRLLARLNYILGDHVEALGNQQKALLMSERVLGYNHPNTIMEYTHLALYCFANGQISVALKLLYRARYLMLTVCGENHPETAALDSNIGLVLHGVTEYDLSLRFLEKALENNVRYHGLKSLKVALSHHLLGRVYSSKAEFRSALQHEKETYTIYKNQFGESHENTRESSEFLRKLTQQAVALQRTMNDLYSNGMGSNASLTQLQIAPPTLTSILEQMNMINGILFIPLSPSDLEKLRAEMQRRQSLQDALFQSTSITLCSSTNPSPSSPMSILSKPHGTATSTTDAHTTTTTTKASATAFQEDAS
uniref:clustered mitochondria protein homolog isoform X2 n=1 Tax=Myxine glutinosa TaxID=7769 RepID=UPI00358E5CE2